MELKEGTLVWTLASPGQSCSAKLECPLLSISGYCSFHESRARQAWMPGDWPDFRAWWGNRGY